jgi:hypothetical protein
MVSEIIGHQFIFHYFIQITEKKDINFKRCVFGLYLYFKSIKHLDQMAMKKSQKTGHMVKIKIDTNEIKNRETNNRNNYK